MVHWCGNQRPRVPKDWRGVLEPHGMEMTEPVSVPVPVSVSVPVPVSLSVSVIAGACLGHVHTCLCTHLSAAAR
eukprot:6241834-Alexandrium_andersonii.AAC.1